jgi:hypothetical protein
MKVFYNKDESNIVQGPLLELQYCKEKLSADEVIKHGYHHWGQDSYYMQDGFTGSFIKLYADVLGNGTYANMKEGPIDNWGVNYYGPEKIDEIIDKANELKPLEYEFFVKWLEEAKNYNGFFILGV